MTDTPPRAAPSPPDDDSIRLRLYRHRGMIYRSDAEYRGSLVSRHEFRLAWNQAWMRARLRHLRTVSRFWQDRSDAEVESLVVLTLEDFANYLEQDARYERCRNPLMVRLFGNLLYECLFGPGDLLGGASLGHRPAAERTRALGESEGPGDTVTLRIQLDDQQPELWAVAWEYLWHPAELKPYAVTRQFAVIREVYNLPKVRPPATRERLRLLLAVANPADSKSGFGLEEFDVEAAIESVQAALDGHDVEFRLLDFCSRDGLASAVADFQPQVLHVICHGLAEADSSWLLLEDSHGEGVRVSGADLTSAFRAQPQLGLVILDGCLTAHESCTQAYRSVATAILEQKVPCVLAAQHLLADASIKDFCRALYGALASGASLSNTVSNARFTLGQDECRAAWGTHALYANVTADFSLTAPSLGKRPPLRAKPKNRFGESLAPMPRHFVRPNRAYRALWQAIEEPRESCVVVTGKSGCGKSVLVARVLERQPASCLVLVLRGSQIAAPPGPASVRFFEALGSVRDPKKPEIVQRLRDPNRPLAQRLQDWWEALPREEITSLVVVLDEFEHLLRWDGQAPHGFAERDMTEIVKAILDQSWDHCTFLFISSRDFDLSTSRLGRVVTVALPELTEQEAQLLWERRPSLPGVADPMRARLRSWLGRRPRSYWLFCDLLDRSPQAPEQLAGDPRQLQDLMRAWEDDYLVHRIYELLTHDEQRLLASLAQRGPLDANELARLGLPEVATRRLRQLCWVHRIETDQPPANAGALN